MRFLRHLPFVFLALIPIAIGILAIMNNISGFNGTMINVIMPMFSMSHVSDTSAKALRAINHPILIYMGILWLCLLSFL